jgi:hypothetical protein
LEEPFFSSVAEERKTSIAKANRWSGLFHPDKNPHEYFQVKALIKFLMVGERRGKSGL